MVHSFNIELATRLGIEEAIILHSFYFWINKNVANDKHLHDGRYWTYNSSKALGKLFPYMSDKKIWRIINQLTSDEIIIKGRFNQSPYDRTSWYSFSDKGLKILADCGYEIGNFTLQNPISQKCEMKSSEKENVISKSEKPIPVNNTDIITNNISVNNNYSEDDFDDLEEDDDCLPFGYTEEEKAQRRAKRIKERELEKQLQNPIYEGLNLNIAMLEVINEWKAYKKERRQTYTPKGEIMFIKKLLEYSKGCVSVAKQIVENSMANNYAGIYEPKQTTTTNRTGVMLNVNDLWK